MEWSQQLTVVSSGELKRQWTIKLKFKNEWLHSRGHAKMYARAKYRCCRTSGYCKAALNGKTSESHSTMKYRSKWPSSKPDLEIIKTKILSKIHDDHLKNVTSWMLTRFHLIWPCELVFDPKWSSFKPALEINTNILCKIHDDYFKNVTSKVLTRCRDMPIFLNVSSISSIILWYGNVHHWLC